MKNILLIACFCAIAISSRAQNIKTSTVSWYITQTFDITTGETTATADTIVSVNTSEVEWEKADGTTWTFTVSEVIGQWADINDSGEIVYEAGNEHLHGTVTFERAPGVTKIRLMMTGEVPHTYEFTISGYKVE